MRALCAIAAAALLGGCGDVPSWSASFESGPVHETTVAVTAWRGAVRLRNSADGRIEFRVRGAAPPPVERPWVAGRGGRVALVVPEGAKDADLEIEVAAPPGVSVSCACADAAVDVEGAWGRLQVGTAAGAISARVERADSGELESRSGAVLYAAAKGPTGELAARSIRGDVTVRLPASWNGQIDCAAAAGDLDVPPHGNLRTLWDEDRRHVVGHVGPPLPAWQPRRGSGMGNDAEEPAPPPVPTVWASSAQGGVSLRLER